MTQMTTTKATKRRKPKKTRKHRRTETQTTQMATMKATKNDEKPKSTQGYRLKAKKHSETVDFRRFRFAETHFLSVFAHRHAPSSLVSTSSS